MSDQIQLVLLGVGLLGWAIRGTALLVREVYRGKALLLRARRGDPEPAVERVQFLPLRSRRRGSS